jgi:tetratricopeptide (TPR) repeat protein
MIHCHHSSAASNRRLAGAVARAALVAGMFLQLGGCQMFRHTSPVSQSVAQSRQLSQRGLTAMEHGDLNSAETLLGQAVTACPTDIEARRQYAEALWLRGERDLALQNAEKLVALAPDDPQLQVRVGEMELALGKLEDAHRIAEQVLDLTPNEPRAWALRARVEQSAGQYDRALSDFHRALEYAHDDRQLLFDTAEVYRLTNRPQRALSTLTRLCDTYGPGEEPQQILYLQGLALEALSRYHDAADAFTLALSHGTATPDLLCRLAEAQLASGQAQAADRALEEALSLDPNYAPGRALKERVEIASRPSTSLFP